MGLTKAPPGHDRFALKSRRRAGLQTPLACYRIPL